MLSTRRGLHGHNRSDYHWWVDRKWDNDSYGDGELRPASDGEYDTEHHVNR
jgi:hypothetical protein